MNSCRDAIESQLTHLLGYGGNGSRSRFRERPLKEIAKLQTGIAKGKVYPPNVPVIELPYLRVANVQDGYLDLGEMKTIVLPKANEERYLLQDGDVIICEGGNFDQVGRGAIWRGEVANCVHQNHIFCLRADRSVLIPEFLALQLGSRYGKRYFLGCAKKTSNLASINSTQVKAFPFQLPTLAEQRRFVVEFDALDSARMELESHIAASRGMCNALTEAFT